MFFVLNGMIEKLKEWLQLRTNLLLQINAKPIFGLRGGENSSSNSSSSCCAIERHHPIQTSFQNPTIAYYFQKPFDHHSLKLLTNFIQEYGVNIHPEHIPLKLKNGKLVKHHE